jgi:RHS repeat-associated protein
VLILESLEDRLLPAVITWGNAAGGDWDTPGNWIGGAVPGAGDTAVIPALGSASTVTHSSANTDVVQGLSTATNLTLSAGTLNVTGTLDVGSGASFFLRGGTLANATLASGIVVLTGSGGTLASVTVAAGATVDGSAGLDGTALTNVTGGLTLDGSLLVGGANSGAQLYFLGTQTLAGAGTVQFGANSNDALWARNDGNPAMLTIGSGIQVHGSIGTISSYADGDSIHNDGTIQIAAGGALHLGGANWINAGTIHADAAAVRLSGQFSTAALGNFTASNGTVDLDGTLDNTSATLALSPVLGIWRLRGGTIQGGTITCSGGVQLALTGSGGTLAGVTVAAGARLDGTSGLDGTAVTTITGGLTLDGVAMLGSANAGAQLYFSGTQSLTGNGSVLLGANSNNALFARGSGSPATLTIDRGISIQGGTGTISSYFDGDSIHNNGAIQISAGGALHLAGTNWINAGTIHADGAAVRLSGLFNTAALGELTVAGGTVDLNGTLDNTGATLALVPALGSWRLRGGTIQGGTIAGDGASLVLTGSGGTLAGVTIAAGLTLDATTGLDGTAVTNITGGLTLDGTASLGGTSSTGQLLFRGTQSLSGGGKVIFGTNPNNAVWAQNNGSPATLTIAAGITLQGGSGIISGYNVGDFVLLKGGIEATIPGGSLVVRAGGSNQTLAGYTAITVAAATIVIPESLQVDGPGAVTLSANSAVSVAGNLLGAVNNGELFSPRGAVTLNGMGTAAAPQLLEAMSADRGSSAAGFAGSFSYGSLTLDAQTYVKLVDQSDNAPGGGAEAVYAGSLVVPAGGTLDLNGLHLYVRSASVAGTVLDGTVTQVPDGGALIVNRPTPGSIAAAGEVDQWTFYARAHTVLTTVLDPGSGLLGAPIAPALGWGQVQLLDPAGQVLASTTSSNIGTLLTLAGSVLPVDGTYTIAVSAANSHSTAVGNYTLAVYDVTANIQSLNVNQPTTGLIATPFSTEQWAFTATASTQVRFDLLAASAGGLAFSLTGPNGFVGFAKLGSNSPLTTLPTAGTYLLSAQSTGGSTGSFTFVMSQTSLTLLAAGILYPGTLAGSGQAQLFKITLPAAEVLSIQLTAPTAGDRLELYASHNTAPTRASYDYCFGAPGANQSILVPSAAAGDWYILVYSESVPAAGSFSLRATTTTARLTAITPDHAGNAAPVTLTLSGAGFVNGTTAVLVTADGITTYAPSSFSLDSFSQLTATFPANLPVGTYSVRVTSGGNVDTLPAALMLTAGGVAHLETDLVLPSALGLHALATLYVKYANTGTVAMAAPLLVLSNPSNDRPLLTLDQSRLVAGLWTSATIPDGFSTSISILASGSTPGVLQPGESVTVPVYYAGRQQPWDLTHTTLPFTLGVVSTTDTTPIVWNSLQASLRPDWISSEAWVPIYGNVVALAGNTSGSYVQMLDNNARYLGRLGEQVTDMGQLWTFSLLQANGLEPSSLLATAVDVSMATPGVSLDLVRSFGETINSRYQLGPFGRGWSVPWQESLSQLSDGTVVVTVDGGTQFRYQPDRRNPDHYFSAAADRHVLQAMPGGTFGWKEAGGALTVFRADGKLDRIQGPNANKVAAGYDASGRLTTLTHSSGQALTIAYNPGGLIATIADSAGRQTIYTYDAANQHLKTVQTPAGTTQYTYSIGNGTAREHALTSIRFPDGSNRYYTYDSLGRLTSTFRDGGADRVVYTYDEPGEVTDTNQLGDADRTYFDNHGLPVKYQDALGYITTVEYDLQTLRATRITDPTGQSYTFSYDTAGNPSSGTDALGRQTQFTFGAFNRPNSVTDVAGNRTTFAYDDAGNPRSTTYANGSVDSARFDPLGNPLSFTNRRGQAVGFTVNSAGQVTRLTFPDNSHTDYTYDGHGNLKTATDAAGTITFTYDPASDRLKRVDYPGGRFLQFNYDPATGLRSQMVDQTGFTVNYHYDAAGRLDWLKDGAGTLIVQYAYDAAARLRRKDNGNGTYTTYQYDADGNVLHLINYASGGAANSRFDYTYDGLGLRRTMAMADGTWTYSYDGSGQLTHALFVSTNPGVPNQNLMYNYDALGNRTSTVINGVTTTYVTNNLNQYTAVGGVVQTYDADGNLLNDGTNTYAYDVLGRLTSMTGPGGTTLYTYDALGNRSSGTTNGQTTLFLNDPTGLPSVVAEFDGAGGVVAHDTYGLGLTSRVIGGSAYYYDFDALGSTAGLSNAGGNYVDSYSYLPFGDIQSELGSLPNFFQFVGQAGVQQEPSGALFMRARDYAPHLGRFTTPDPLGLGGGDLNVYRYTHNAPVSAVDPIGLFSLNDITNFLSNITSTVSIGGHLPLSPGFEAGGAASWTFNPFDPLFWTNPFYPSDFMTANGWQGDWQLGGLFDFGGSWDVNWGGNPDWTVSLGTGKFDGISLGFKGWYPVNLGVGVGIGVALPITVSAPMTPAADSTNSATTATVVSQDPNDLLGPVGFGAYNFVRPDQLLPYRIDFENASSATAPAQGVTITDQLAPTLDWSTFRLTEIGFGDTILTIPADSQQYQITLHLTYNGKSFDVLVEAGIHSDTGQVYATFQSVDPNSELPPDVLTGFLPPEDGTGRGMGHISYTIAPKANLATGTEIRNVALITFDQNAAIATDQLDEQDAAKGIDPARQALVTLDAGAPASSVAALPANQTSTSFPVSWSGSDDTGGSGIAFYDVYVSDNSGPFALFKSATKQTSAMFTGAVGHAYGFYSIATDNVGQVQPTPVAAQATTMVTGVPGFTYDPTTRILTIAGTQAQNAFSFSQATTQDAGGTLHTTFNFTLNGNSVSYDDTQIVKVVVGALGSGNSAVLVTNDTYIGNDAATHETSESISLGSAVDAGVGVLQKLDSSGKHVDFLTLSNYAVSYAYVGRGDGVVSLYGTAGVPYNGFVSAGNYSYIGGRGLFHLAQGAAYVYGYGAGQATDFAYHYAANAGSSFVVSGTAFSYMSAMDTVNSVTQSYFNVGVGFLINTGVAKNPGQDYAYIIDSPGNDTFVGETARSYMYSTDSSGNFTEFDAAYAFVLVFGQSFVGGFDTASNGDTIKNILVGFHLK